MATAMAIGARARRRNMRSYESVRNGWRMPHDASALPNRIDVRRFRRNREASDELDLAQTLLEIVVRGDRHRVAIRMVRIDARRQHIDHEVRIRMQEKRHG